MTAPSAAGWYPDPSGAPGMRYFDGKNWTEHRAAPTMPPPPPPGYEVAASPGPDASEEWAEQLLADLIQLCNQKYPSRVLKSRTAKSSFILLQQVKEWQEDTEDQMFILSVALAKAIEKLTALDDAPAPGHEIPQQESDFWERLWGISERGLEDLVDAYNTAYVESITEGHLLSTFEIVREILGGVEEQPPRAQTIYLAMMLAKAIEKLPARGDSAGERGQI